MQLEDYFLFISENDIRIKGNRLGIDNVLFYFLEGYTRRNKYYLSRSKFRENLRNYYLLFTESAKN